MKLRIYSRRKDRDLSTMPFDTFENEEVCFSALEAQPGGSHPAWLRGEVRRGHRKGRQEVDSQRNRKCYQVDV